MLLYLHVPFCQTKCHYCSFHSYTQHKGTKEAYIQAVITQFHEEVRRFNLAPHSLTSFFIGGGTPSTLTPSQFAPLFEIISPYLHPQAEVSTEANPNTAKRAWLEGMMALGVNRISFGVQSFNQDKLAFLGRNHTGDEARHAVETAVSLGFHSVSIDLMYGTAMDTKASLKKELDAAFSLPIAHLSAYALTLEEGTPFFNRTETLNPSTSLARWFAQEIIHRGFEQYEISNFGTIYCQHNLGYWEHKPYIGLGCGAVGYDGTARLYPTHDIQAYLNAPTTHRREEVSLEEIVTEKIFLGLRSRIGFAMDILTPTQQARVFLLEKEGKVRLCENRIYNEDFFLSDELALFIL
ncbi:MAG: coproporphyrinogen III oxidase family protein [Campylobacterales bacterium]|nr:coproporphyrinogen III oxidase family protein [Campylobacterales bacterium]